MNDSFSSNAFNVGFTLGGIFVLVLFCVGLALCSGADKLEMCNHAKKLGAGDWVVNPTTHKAEWKWKDEMTVEAKP